MSAGAPALLVSIGTKAQFIKMAPVLRELDARGVAYSLVYTGQHSETFDSLERAFGTRAADDVMVPDTEAATHRRFLRWTLEFWRAALRRDRRRAQPRGGWVVVHGDTASTLFAALAARMSGAAVAHVEAGLRSPRLHDPFPEELVRRAVSRLATLHLAPDATAAARLTRAPGRVLDTGGNTLLDALRLALRSGPPLAEQGGEGGYAVVSMHRNENLSRRASFDLLMEEVAAASRVLPIRFVLHPATRERLRRSGWDVRLQAEPGIALLPRMDHAEFVRLLIGATCLLTDGGSNQEEAAMLGLPTLLLRRTTERPDGLGDNVALSRLDRDVIRRFVATHAGARWTLHLLSPASPSARVVDALSRPPGDAR